MLLKNKNAVITGSNRGIGREILKIFSENGCNIFACVRKIEKDFESYAKNLEKNNNNSISIFEMDLSQEDQIKSTANKIISEKNIDILINNAAAIHTANFQMTSLKKFNEIFQINFFSQLLFTQYIIKSMVKNKNGSIVFLSSTSAFDGNEGRSAYSSSKAALASLSKTLSKEYGSMNIRVNTIAPGLTKTDMMKDNTPQNIIEEIEKNSSLKRLGNTKDIANVALFLSSDLSSYITGQTIRVDGGIV